MQSILRIFALALLFFAASIQAQAQRDGWNADPAQRAEQQTATMKEKLSLSEKQAEKVGAINLKYANKMKEAREANPDADWSAMRETMAALRQEQDKELKGVMTQEQFDNWLKIREEMRNQRGPKGDRKGKQQDKSN